MPTGRGWLCLISGVGAIFLGWFLGLVEMYVIGASLVMLAFVATAVAFLRPLRLAVGRVVTPNRLHVGSVARVELAVRNGPSKAPVVRMTDKVQGTSGAQLLLSPMAPDAVSRAAYRLPTERRGLVALGPVEFEATDAFGLAIRQFTSPTSSQLVVYPEVIPIPPAPPSPANERRSSSRQQEFIGGRSEEFHASRIYVPGDDIRRINWAASARHDDLVVREDETPTQNHLTILLDNVSLGETDPLDKGASVAASLVTSMRNRSDPFRLVTLDGHDTGYVIGPSGIDQALSILAVVARAERAGNGGSTVQNAQGTVVVVTGQKRSIGNEVLENFGRRMIISLAASVWGEGTERTASSAEVVGTEVRIRLGSMDDLAAQWIRAISTLMGART